MLAILVHNKRKPPILASLIFKEVAPPLVLSKMVLLGQIEPVIAL